MTALQTKENIFHATIARGCHWYTLTNRIIIDGDGAHKGEA
jgi:hypothetical protein